MSKHTYGYIDKVKQDWLDLLGLRLIQDGEEAVIVGLPDDVQEYKERELNNDWRQ